MGEMIAEPAAPAAEPVAPAEPLEPNGGNAEPVAPAAPAEPVAPAAVPVWDDPAVLELVDTRAQALFTSQMEPLIPLLEQLLGGGAGGAAAVEAGPLNPWDEGYAGNLEARFKTLEQTITEKLDQLAAPMEQRAQAETLAEGEQRLKDILVDEISRNGDFATDPVSGQAPGQLLVRPLADLFFPEFAARFGASPRAAEFAMQKAAGVVRQLEDVAGKVAIAKHTNQLETLAGANGEVVAGGGVGVQTVGDIKARSIDEGLRSVTARHAEAIRNGG